MKDIEVKCWNKSKSAQSTNWIDEYCWIWMTSISFWINWIHLNNLLEVNWKWMNNDPWKWMISEQLFEHLKDVSSHCLNEWNLDRCIALNNTIFFSSHFEMRFWKQLKIEQTSQLNEWSDECPIDDLSFLFSFEIEQLICFLLVDNFLEICNHLKKRLIGFLLFVFKTFEIRLKQLNGGSQKSCSIIELSHLSCDFNWKLRQQRIVFVLNWNLKMTEKFEINWIVYFLHFLNWIVRSPHYLMFSWIILKSQQ